MQLIGDLQRTTEGDPSRDAKLSKIREQLESQFDSMHQMQAKEIAEVERRLESLQEIHDTRTENKEKIVQRRIDQLLGNWDELGWDPQPNSSQPTRRPSYQSGFYPTTNPPIGSRPLSTAPTNQYGNGLPGTASIPRRTPAMTRDSAAEFGDLTPGPGVTVEPGFRSLQNLFAQPQVRPDSSPVPTIDRDPSRTEAAISNDDQLIRSEDSTSALFDLARRTANAKNKMKLLAVELAQNQDLHEKDAIPFLQLQKTVMAHKQATEEVRLYDLERRAMEDMLKLQVKDAKAKLQKLHLQLRRASEAQDPNAATTLDSKIEQASAAERRSELYLQQLEKAFETTAEDETPETESPSDEERIFSDFNSQPSS